jgi:micrococcal nuclease
VVDGDTLVVTEGTTSTKLRLIGLDTPETVDPRKPVQCFGREASDEAKKLLSGQEVRLEYDPSQGMLDKYGRTLAYVFLTNGTLFNEFMIAEGYGHEYTYNLPYKYQKEFKAAEAQARANLRGLWAPDSCNGNTSKPAASS